MRILFLHEVSYQSKPIFEMHEFPEYLASRGHEVVFLDYEEHAKPEIGGPGVTNVTIPGRVSGSVRLDLITLRPRFAGQMGRVATAFSFLWTSQKMLRQIRPDVVVSYAVPTIGWQMLLASRRMGIPFVFRSLDVSHRIRKTAFWPLVRTAEKWIYNNADFVSTNNPALLEYCRKLGARPADSGVLLPPLDFQAFALSQIQHEAPNLVAKKSSHDQIVLYMGSFFYFSGLLEVLACLGEAKDRPLLVLIGGGEQDEELRRYVSEMGLEEDVLFTGYVNYDELIGYFNFADVAINPMQRSEVSNFALPNKVLQYMASKLPVVSTRLDGLEMTVGRAPGLFLVESPSEVLPEAQRVAALGSRRKLGKQNYEYAAKLFSVEDSVMQLEQLLELVTSK